MSRKIIDVPLHRIDPERRVSVIKVFGYAAALFAGVKFPPVHLERVGHEISDPIVWKICDGGHRVAAHRLTSRTTIRARVYCADD